MEIKLSLKENDVSIVLLDGKNKIDEEKWVDENNLLEKFFPIVNNMMKKNNISIDDVKKFSLETNIPSGYTTARIARIIIKTLNFAQKS